MTNIHKFYVLDKMYLAKRHLFLDFVVIIVLSDYFTISYYMKFYSFYDIYEVQQAYVFGSFGG